MSSQAESEFRRFVAVEEIEAAGTVERAIDAREDERRALAGRFGLLALKSLSASLTLRRLPGGPLVRVDGRVVADVEQRCVISLEPVAEHIDETFSETFAPEGYEPPDELEEEDLPETFESGGIDIGELAAQHLALSLDPYPRAPGVEVPADLRESHETGADERRRPFAALDDMLKKRH